MIGSMRSRITFRQPTTVLVPGGGHIASFEVVYSVFAKAEPLKSPRELENSQIQMDRTIKFTTRQLRPSPTKSWLIYYLGSDYTINDIRVIDERNRFMEIIATSNGLPPEPFPTT